MNNNAIFITGYAKLPRGITASALYTVIAVAMVIDEPSGQIEDVECSLATKVSSDFIRNLLVGQSILDYDQIVEVFGHRYHGSARKAILSAIKSVNEKYKILCAQREEETAQ